MIEKDGIHFGRLDAAFTSRYPDSFGDTADAVGKMTV